MRGGDAESEKAMRELVGTSDSPEKSAAAIQRLARELAGLDEDFTQYCEGHDKPDFVPVFTVKSMRMLLPQAEVSGESACRFSNALCIVISYWFGFETCVYAPRAPVL